MSEKMPNNEPAGEHERSEQAFHDDVIFLVSALGHRHAKPNKGEFYCDFFHDERPELSEEYGLISLSVNAMSGGSVLVGVQYLIENNRLRNDEYVYNIFDRELTISSTIENCNDLTSNLEASMDDLDEQAMEVEEVINTALEKMEQPLRSLSDLDQFFERFDRTNRVIKEQFEALSESDYLKKLAELKQDNYGHLFKLFDELAKHDPGFAKMLEVYQRALAYSKMLEYQMDEVEARLKREKNVTEIDDIDSDGGDFISFLDLAMVFSEADKD